VARFCRRARWILAGSTSEDAGLRQTLAVDASDQPLEITH
jgi:hypothetical protein